MISITLDDVYGIVGFALLATIMFCQIGPVIEHQDRCITEYCVMHPTETITGDMTINCSEWLTGHPELVAEYESPLLDGET